MQKLNLYKFIAFALFFMVSVCSLVVHGAVNARSVSELYASGKYKEAFKAASSCSTEAVCQDLLGRMYYFGNGIERNEEKSLHWIQKASDSGVPYAKFLLALYLEQGDVIQEDSDLAQTYYADALESLTVLAKSGDAAAQFFIGYMYMTGYGVEENYKAARIWFKKSAEKNYVDAQFLLGYMYDEGEGGPEDNITAIKWYTLAANNGHASAQNNLAVMYEQGEGVPVDLKKARYWYEKAAKNGNEDAQENLDELNRHQGDL